MRLIIFLFLLQFGGISLTQAADVSCECPSVKCENPCLEQKGLTFYTEKCAQGKKVKSCAKPRCIEMVEPTEACLAYRKGLPQNRSVASEETVTKKLDNFIPLGNKVGKITFLKGKAWIKAESGSQRDARLNADLREYDTIITASNGRLQAKLANGNLINVLPNSMLKMTEVDLDQEKTLMDLYKGKVRSSVNSKVKLSSGFFKVRTKSAVAGVRGTDFVVTYEVTQKAVTKVQTIEGSVELASGDEKQKQTVLGGQEASFVVAANDSEMFSDDEINDFIARGYMTPVYKMTANEVDDLKWKTNALNNPEVGRHLASKKQSGKNICAEPRAELHQCKWTCENNPQGEKRCRTDLPQVHCVRKRCNANGEWADETRLPATYFDKCAAAGDHVDKCDY